MPYTFAHIGYILPLKKKWPSYFSITGLVFGSIAPDYDILFRLTEIRFHIFQYDLKTICFLIFPLAALSALFFHLFCRKILIRNLPPTLYEKYQKYLDFDFINYLKYNFHVFSTSIFFAILLHLFLDFLCHILDAYQVTIYTQSIVNNIAIANAFGYLSIYFLPVIFSIFGFYFIYKFKFANHLNSLSFIIPKKNQFFWITIFLSTLIVSFLKIIFTRIEIAYWTDLVVISITSSFLFSIYLVCFCYFINNKFSKLFYV